MKKNTLFFAATIALCLFVPERAHAQTDENELKLHIVGIGLHAEQ